jgi:nitrate reductase gamma subunit
LYKPILFILIFVGIVLTAPGAMAADPVMMPPVLDGKQRDCLDCHRYPNVNTNEGAYASQAFCMECHGQNECRKTVDGQPVSLRVDLQSFEKTRHKYTSCIQCHTDVAKCPHASESGAQCTGCHSVHGEKEVHDPHLRVNCQACHRTSKFVVLDKESGQVRLSRVDDQKAPISLTDHALPDVTDAEFCRRCHHAENKVGAAAAVLPSKSFLCILCHSAPLSIGHPMFWVAFIIFVFGVILTLNFWFKGSVRGEETSVHRKVALTSETVWQVIVSRQVFTLMKVVLLDIILQRRILQESVNRWSIHSLIYLSILARLFVGLLTYFAYRIGPDSSLALALLNKNNGFTAFFYDLTGLFIVFGIVWAVIQRYILKPVHVAREGQDNLAIAIIGVLILLGFLLEAVRILMTQIPPSMARFSFIGYPLARLMGVVSLDWKVIYPWLWYAHAGVGALLIAYLPFGKMRHVFNTPLTLMMNYKMK